MPSTEPVAAFDDDVPASVAEMLAISERQKQRIGDLYRRPTTAIVFIWGFAWLVGFLLQWSASAANLWFRTPSMFATVGFVAVLVTAAVASIVIGARTGRGVQGPSQEQGTLYGISWGISTAAAGVFGGAMVANGMDGDLATLFFPAVYCLVVGTLYLAGGALALDKSMFVMGCWIIAVGVSAPFFGVPANALVMALAGGGGFIVYGVLLMTMGHRIVPHSAARIG